MRPLLLLLLTLPLLSPAPPPGARPVLVELFTSEGCSSCPAADKVLLELDEQQPLAGTLVVALGFHVDYWNRLGWKDAYSDKAYTARQRAYVRRMGLESAYTPQAVVNGAVELVGSKKAELTERIRQAADEPAAWVQVRTEGLKIIIDVDATEQAPTRPADVWLAVAESGIATPVRRGENAGRTLRHAPLVRALQHAGALGAGDAKGAFTFLLPQPLGTRQHLVAFLQEEDGGRVLGVGQLRGAKP